MDPLPRHRRGRKHSAAGNAVSPASSSSLSFSSPYDDVLLSKEGKNTLGAHEYAEIFAGSPSSSLTSIPLFDLSSLDEQVGLEELRSSRIDYSYIFGGLRNDDVVVPYEELFKGAAKRNKVPADGPPPRRESSSLRSSGNTKRPSGEASDHSFDGMNQQLNMSFNKTSQGNIDTSNGKTHIAELHAVPGFTHFVDGTPRPCKKEGGSPVPPLQREVSRTWSFSGGSVGRLTSEKSRVSHKSCNGDGINLVAHSTEMPSPSSYPSNPNNNNDPKHFQGLDFKDAWHSAELPSDSRRFGEYSPPRFDEVLDENSVAAASAAALKKAVEKAQESIRIARMIMERKKEGLQGAPKPTVWSEVKDKNETRINFEFGCLKENNGREAYERLNSTVPVFSGINANFTSALDHTEIIFNPRKAEAERVAEKFAVAKENGGACAPDGTKLATSSTRNGGLYAGEELAQGTFEAADEHRKGKLAESAPNASKSVDDAVIEFKATVNIIKGTAFAESSERIFDAMQEEKIARKAGENLRIMPEDDEAVKESEDVANVMLKHGKKRVGHEEMVVEDHMTICKLEFNDLLGKLRNVAETDVMRHIDMEKISATSIDWKDDWPHGNGRDEENGSTYTEGEQQPNDICTIICDAGLNDVTEEYPAAAKGCEESGSLTGEPRTLSSVEEDDTEKFIHQRVNDAPEMDCLRRCASEENFIGSKLNGAFEDFTEDSNSKLLGEGNIFKTASVILDAESILEDIDGLSAHESQECAEDAWDSTSTEEEVRNAENDADNLGRPSTMQEKDGEGNGKKVETNDCQERIEVIKRGREREKDRLAVERAIREARERAFAEARERAEKAAMERAAAEPQEKLEMASMDSKQTADKLSNEAKVRSERAAVERATAEARERALEKAMSHKTYIEAKTQTERLSTERFSSFAKEKGLKYSFSSSDLEKFDDASSESAQRRKAKLERHQRIMERAATALAEKNKRDLLVLQEQAERNRLAETLDAEIKRWASGKEGNLRALLSTLQYILGSDSGWKATSLTEIITTAAVKKAYRRATLCVHPDKLQQRGASIQQKYICEKVFNLLKAARNRFNAEES